MDLAFTREELAFRDEVRAFLDRHLAEHLRAGTRGTPTVFAEPDIGLEWMHTLQSRGWLAYNWPTEYGGPGWTPVQRYIFEKECALADAPGLPVLGLKLLAPVVWTFGTAAQKAHYLPRVLTAEHYWCQGFSEPGSGSDLASLKTRATRTGSHYVVQGSKIWTTHAHFANHIFCLVRTNPDVKPQQGISFLMIDMETRGITVRPIRGIGGDHEVNEVFFDDVVVPAANLVGEEGQGWTIAKFLLEYERGGSCHAPRLLADIAKLRDYLNVQPGNDGGKLSQDPAIVAALGRLELEAQALEMTELRILAQLARGEKPGPQSSLLKLVASNLHKDVDALLVRFHAYAGLQLEPQRPLYGDDCPDALFGKAAQLAAPRYLNSQAWPIFGGSNEIQRTIIAKSVLNL
jgi:alkylation response protein AidB-like acyl-CoA dehydrogenase